MLVDGRENRWRAILSRSRTPIKIWLLSLDDHFSPTRPGLTDHFYLYRCCHGGSGFRRTASAPRRKRGGCINANYIQMPPDSDSGTPTSASTDAAAAKAIRAKKSRNGKNARLESAALAHPEVLWVNPVCCGVAVRGRGQTMLFYRAAHCRIATLLATGEGDAMGIVTSRFCARPDLDLALYQVRWNAEPRTAVVSETGVSMGDDVRWIKWGGGRKSCAGGHVVAAHCDSASDRRRFGCVRLPISGPASSTTGRCADSIVGVASIESPLAPVTPKNWSASSVA